ncbi:hypothetical protein GWI33_001863 [Rhynchophorus ferrugineus]|uniref:Uncharacterized protein n=1 Tax=Rhynchophorus ferrugineus TaxID=354439 RepID=A0A834HLJ1_RHYFE|nr:hypothetical protein GWI33_001862 [Rhynchophorus ferrugineus]KAF7263569.1 hypothetical protein GWI33_001863 [Rhynchophorus ferrugineus]
MSESEHCVWLNKNQMIPAVVGNPAQKHPPLLNSAQASLRNDIDNMFSLYGGKPPPEGARSCAFGVRFSTL